jgi:hypothetical protein
MKMLLPETAKPAAANAASGLRKSEQLGGRLSYLDTESLPQNQARFLRQHFAVGFHLAVTLAPLIWGVAPR